MDKKTLESLVAKDESLGKNKLIGIRIPLKTFRRLEDKGISGKSLSQTVRNFLERLAE